MGGSNCNESQIEGAGAESKGGRNPQIENPSDRLEKGGPARECRANPFRTLGRVGDQFLDLKNGLHAFILKILTEPGLCTGIQWGAEWVPILVDLTLTNKETDKQENSQVMTNGVRCAPKGPRGVIRKGLSEKVTLWLSPE